MITVDEAIAQANAILPHAAAPEGDLDLRWQAIIGVGEFIESDPAPVWDFVRRWARDADQDLQAALATCLLEHLLEHHFDRMFTIVQQAARADRSIARLVVRCWAVGVLEAQHAAVFEALKRECNAAVA